MFSLCPNFTSQSNEQHQIHPFQNGEYNVLACLVCCRFEARNLTIFPRARPLTAFSWPIPLVAINIFLFFSFFPRAQVWLNKKISNFIHKLATKLLLFLTFHLYSLLFTQCQNERMDEYFYKHILHVYALVLWTNYFNY